MSSHKTPFGRTDTGVPVDLYTCTNKNGLVLRMTNYGAIVVSLEVPDREGKLENITLGFPRLDGYLLRHPYFGATVGRFCNRIAGARFQLDGMQFELAANNGPNALHGGIMGFDKVVWSTSEIRKEDAVGVAFEYVSAHGEEGYPGNLHVTAIYLLTNDDELTIEFKAATDRPTPINLTNHTYWNLGGQGSGTVLGQQLTILADRYLPVDEQLIPTGELAPVQGTPLDFTSPTEIGSRIQDVPGGYDHCYVLRNTNNSMAKAAKLRDPGCGRVMEVHTTQPGLQFYSGNFLDGSESAAGFERHEGLCLETQHFPNSPNEPGFPSTILRPGQTYRQRTIHRFCVE